MGLLDDAVKSVQQSNSQQARPMPDIPKPIVSPATDQRTTVAGVPATLHGVTQEQADAAVVPPSTGGSLLSQALASNQPTTAPKTPTQTSLLNDNDTGLRATLNKAWGTTVNAVGHLVPDWAERPMAADVKYIANPLDTVGDFLEERGRQVGTSPAQLITGIQKRNVHQVMQAVTNLTSFANPAAVSSISAPTEEEEKSAAEMHPYLTGVGGGAGKFAGSMVSPVNLALMVAIPEEKAFPILNKTLKYAFQTQMGAAAISQISNLVDNWGKMSKEQRTEALTQLPLQVGAILLAHMKGKAPEEGLKSTQGTVAGERTSVKSTTQKTAGVEAPILASQQENPSLLTRVTAATAKPGAATEFQNEFTKPAAQRQAISTLSQVATDKIAAHEALVNGEQAPEGITGTQTPGEHETPDEIWSGMQDATKSTWDKARSVSAQEQEAWQRERQAAEQNHQTGIDHYNELVDAHNADPANANNQMARETFNPDDVDLRERPQTFDELKAALDAAKERTADQSTEVRQKARDIEVPKAEKALDAFFKEHGDKVSAEEYESAKKLWADSERFKEIASNLRPKLAKETLSGKDIRGLESFIDGKAVRRRGQAGIGEFKRLVGPEAYDNLQKVSKLFDPLEKTDPRASVIGSWGSVVMKQILGGGLGYLLGGPEGLMTGEAVAAGATAGKTAFSWLANKIMFNPEFGESFGRLVDATKDAVTRGTQVPVDLLRSFRELVKNGWEKYQSSKLGGEEGAVSVGGVKRARTGPTPRPENWPSDEDLLKKYGESSDPAQTAFLLTDGRKVAMKGTEHDRMLGGKPTDDFRTPYINETGNIRVRGYGSYGDRQFAMSLPKSGITEQQLNEIKKWGPQLRTGRVYLEQADANGKNVVLHNATNEQLEDAIRKIVPVKEAPASTSVSDIADEYNKSQGRPALDTTKVDVDPRRQQIADDFESMKHDPTDPKVKASYSALVDELKAQKAALEAKGYTFSLSDKDPYSSYEEMRDDVKNNKHITVWTGGNPLEEGHPLAKKLGGGWDGNTLLRAVHDVMGHVAGDNDFSEKGEENAYNLHKQTFSEKALPALTTETKGQTSWFFNHEGVRNGEPLGKFAPQKAGLLPEPKAGDFKLISHDEFVKAVKSNSQAASLTPPEKSAGNQHYSDGAGVYYSISPEGDLQGVINNSGKKGALARVMPDAIKNGAKTLDAWDIYLPKQYAKYGFVPTEHVPYDFKTYGEPSPELKDAWKQQGWKEGDPYPGVQMMKLQVGSKAAAVADTDFYFQAKAEKAAGTLAPGMSVARRAQELKDAAKAVPQDLSASEITTRRPKAVGADMGNNPGQHANMDAVEQASLNNPSRKTALGKDVMGYKEKLARTVAGYTGVDYTPEDLANPDKVLSKFVNHVAGNLEWLYNEVPEELRQRTRQWYDAANKIVSDKAKSYGFTPEQGAGVTAALSPQNPWDNNVGLADRMMDIFKNRQDFPFSPEMEQKAAELKKVPTQSKAFKGLLRDVSGKALKDVTNPNPDVQAVQRALWIRLYDEAHGNPVNDQYAPTGNVVGHSPDTRSWVGLDHSGKAVKILEDGSVSNINDVMGQGHKIRNFYNNLINPNSKAGHVTIDTHATGAGLLIPAGTKDTESAHTFGGTTPGTPGAPKDAATGLQGTYPLYAEAYQRVARKLGIKPRELQSVTWEAAKSLFDNKTPELKAEVKNIWQQVQDGKLTPAEARDKIKTAAHGFSKPAWMSEEEWEKLGPEGEDTSFNPEGGE